MRIRQLLPIVLGAALLATAGAALARPVRVGTFVEIPYGVPLTHPYATSRGDDRRTGRARAKAPAQAPTKRWEMALRSNVLAAPAVLSDGRIAVGSQFGVSMISASGEVIFGLGIGTVGTTPAITPESEILVPGMHGLIARIGPSGGVLGEIRVATAAQASLLVLADGSFVAVGLDQALHRYDVAGNEIFRAQLNRPAITELARTRRGEIAIALGAEVLLYTPTGDLRATVPVGGDIVAGPVVGDDGTIWVATADRALLALSPGGSVRTRATVDVEMTAPSLAIATDGSLWLATSSSDLLHIAPTGTVRHRIGGTVIASGITLDADDAVLGVTDRSRLVRVEPDGTVRWAIELGQRVAVPPTLAPDGTIYIVNSQGTVTAYR